ncbi:MAG TPA: hypothetical protein VF183_05690 [Acidimicrobiales bacterium]
MSTDRYAELKPGAVVAALRSLPKRFRGVLAADPTRDPDELARTSTDDGRSVRDVIASTGDALELIADALGKVLVLDEAPVPAAVTGHAVEVTADAGIPLQELLDRLEQRSNAAADHVERAPGADLLRTGVAPGGARVSAIDIARQAVRVSAENLLVVQRALRAAGVDLDDSANGDG